MNVFFSTGGLWHKTWLGKVSGKIPTWKTLQPSIETSGHGNLNERF